jgi:hypothetical protein
LGLCVTGGTTRKAINRSLAGWSVFVQAAMGWTSAELITTFVGRLVLGNGCGDVRVGRH